MGKFLLGDSILTKYGIRRSSLLSYVKKPKGFRAVEEVCFITNELVLELIKLKDENSDVTFTIFYEWIVDVYGEKWPHPDSPTCQALSKSVTRLMAKLAKLKKMRSSTEKEALMSKFFAEEYILPRLGYHKGRVISFSPQRPPRKRKIECDDQVKEMRQKMYDMTRNANKRIKRRVPPFRSKWTV